MNFKGSIKALGAILYKNRAKIEFVAGTAAVAVGTAMIVSKATRASEIADDLESKNRVIRKKDANDGWDSKKERSDARKEVVGYAFKEYTKCYWKGFAVEALGITLMSIGFGTSQKELSNMAALAASYATTLGLVKERVIADQGEEKWQEYLLGPQVTKVEVLEDGTVVQTTTPVDNPNRGANLPPHCYFWSTSRNYEKDPVMNRDRLESAQRWLDEKLWTEGFLLENGILKDLQLPLVKSGFTAGILAETVDPVTGDRVRNHIDLGLGAMNQAAQRFRDGIEPDILLQLNVENNIIDKLNLPMA
jgi:hypothetical protein